MAEEIKIRAHHRAEPDIHALASAFIELARRRQ